MIVSKLTEDQINELTTEANKLFKGGHLRIGQSYMNALYHINKDLYNEITATEYDCFYQDNLVLAFMKYITNE